MGPCPHFQIAAMKPAVFTCLLLALASLSMPSRAEKSATVSVRELPQALRQHWQFNKPEMSATSRCAAAWDSHTDTNKMTLDCSIYIRMAAEGERRALAYCEEKRQKLQIHAPCRIVTE